MRLLEVVGYSRDGSLSSEHVDAVVKGVAHVVGRSEDPVTAEQQTDFERKLLNHAISGAPPAEIGAAARALGNEVAQDTDGSDDSRTLAQRRADALHQLLDCGGGGQTLVSVPRTEVNVTVPADHPEASTLPRMGPVTEGLVRKAIIIRDVCCVTCGGHASWSDCHHIVHFVDGGLTTLENGCLLCRTCHMAVHNTGWDVIMGSDGHPWMIPPADIDPQRRPLPAYNRRTLTLAA